jgi:phosphatidylserine/phosphatidylglycerophosphate/cardiolipin synthase-like enzyme
MKRILCGVSLIALAAMPSLFAVRVAGKEPIANYQVFFSPDDKIADELVALIRREKHSIRAAVYCLMHHGIAQALIEAHTRGVDVEVILDPYSVKSRSPMKKMEAAHLPVFVWDPAVSYRQLKSGKRVKQRKPLMHDKFCVLGESKVWTGSFNFTFESARTHRENVIVLESAEIAGWYLEEFERLKDAGCVPLEKHLASVTR